MEPGNDFEQLLLEQENFNVPSGRYTHIKESNRPLRADKTATLFDFIQMINKIMSSTMRDVLFIPDEGKTIDLDSQKKINKPIITYKVISRKVKNELKPRLREEILEDDADKNDQRIGRIYGQKFKCILQFDIFASVYTSAEKVMKEFEEMIFKFTSYFKKKGVAEILFYQQFTDSDDEYKNLRQILSVRNLQYYIEIENQTVMFDGKIKEIESLINKKEE